jgi:hypothetical protein
LAESLASLYEQVVKPAQAKGGGTKAVATKDVSSTSIGFYTSAFDGSPASGNMLYNTQ